MTTKSEIKYGRWMQFKHRLTVPAGMLVLLLALPAAVQAQFTYTTNDGTITITGYTLVEVMEWVDIPSTIDGLPVVSIGKNAFSQVPLVTGKNRIWVLGVTMPDSVTNIGDNAFYSSPYLTDVSLGCGVISIGNSAFYDCPSLTTIWIPSSVTSIGAIAFADCPTLNGITVDAGNTAYSSLDGVLLNKSQTTLVEYPGGKPGRYTVPDTVTSIGEQAFYFCTTNLTSVTIPSSVTNIGDWAFEYCYSLASVTIGDRVTSIGYGAFSCCTRLTDVVIPSSITSIPAWAFDSCRSLTNITIPNSVASIESWAFQYCYSLASVTIGSGVTNVANEAFYDCTNLAALTVDPLNSVYSSVDSVLFNKSQTTLIQYPAGKAGSYAIPNTVTGIGDQAFWSRTRLASVTIPDTVTSIGEQAFYFCVSLTNVTMGNSVTSIGSGAFCFCTNLTRLTIPTNVSSIGSYAFEDCYSLNGIYFMGNAPGLGGAYVFSGDNNATVYYLPGTTGWGPTFGGLPTALWVEVPTIQTAPQTQTAEEGSAVGFWAQATSALPLSYAWYFDNTNFLSCNAGGYLELTNVQLSQAGAYTVIISNALGAVTSAPFMLNVIPSVERRPVPGVKVVGEIGNSLNLEQTESLGKTAHWLPLDSVTLTNPPQYWFDVTKPLPSQRYYRAREVSDPPVLPTLDLHMVPAITLTGNIGDELRLDCINAIGPTDAWVTLDTITLTNTSQLYFDTNAVDQPTRLYRIVPEP